MKTSKLEKSEEKVCKVSPNGSVYYKGVLLKKVTSRNINEVSITYFQCPNSRKPKEKEPICLFKAKIFNFPFSTNLELISGHSPRCSYFTNLIDKLLPPEKKESFRNENYLCDFSNLKNYEIKSSIKNKTHSPNVEKNNNQMLQKKRERSEENENPLTNNFILKNEINCFDENYSRSSLKNYHSDFVKTSNINSNEDEGKIQQEYFDYILNV
jgi:hypothetical protein